MSSAGRTISYAELDRLSDMLARRMAAVARPAGTVAVRSDDRADHVVGLVAALKCGLTWVALDPDAPAARTEGIIARTGAALVPPVRDVPVPDPLAAAHEQPRAEVPPQSLAYVVHTSGTTGEPKGVAVAREALDRHLAAVRDAFGLTEDDVVLQFSAPYVDVWVEQVLGALTAGAHLVLTGRGVTTPHDLAALIRRAGVTVANLPAGYWQEFTASLTHIRADLASLRLMVAGSDTMPAASAERWERETGIRLLNAYGPTETVITSLLHEVCGQRADTPVPVGRALGPRNAYVLDERLRPVRTGETGELYVGGDALAAGYLQRPGQTAERFLPDPFAEPPGGRMYRTGDLVRLLPDGTLEFGGRQDGQVKIRGFRIEPGEVENVLARHPQVATCAVGVRERGAGDRTLVAYVTPVEGADVREEELREHLRGLLPAYMVPASFVRVAALPLTAGGKVDRAALSGNDVPRTEDATDLVPLPDVAAPAPTASGADGDALERVLCEIWSDVLGIADIGPDDNFFLLGGDSLTALRVAGRLMDTPWADAAVTVFEAPTIRELVAAMSTRQVAAEAAVGDAEALVRTGAARGPLSGVQRGLWLLTQLAPDTTAYNIPWVFELDAPLDPRALREALTALVARHESLRTTFGVMSGEPCQVVHANMDVPLAVSELSGPDDDAGAVEELVRQDAGTPFDLDEGPLLRMRLIRHGRRRCTLVVVVHHIVWDEPSLRVLERDLAELYRAAVSGERPDLPDLPVSCVDHSLWLNRSAARQEQLDHWRKVLAGAPEISAPPTDRPRGQQVRRVAGSVRFALRPATARRVRALARATRSTPYTVLMAGYAALLHQLTGTEDVVVGTPVTTRGRPELQDLIGYFVNLVPVRLRFGANSAFRAVVEQMRDVSFDALAHRDIPLDAIVGAALADRRTDADPLFQTVFELHSGSADPVRIGGARGTRRLHAHSAAKFELAWMIEESGDDIKGWLEYDAGLYDAAGMRDLCERWLALLDSFTESPHTPVGEASSTGQAGTGLLVEEFECWARRTPDAPALQDTDGSAVVSYGRLDAQANRFAWWLRSSGVRVGDVVGLHLPRSARWVAAMLGVLKAGAAYLPLEPHLPHERLESCIRDTAPAVVLTDDPRTAAGFGAPVLDVRDGAAERCPTTGTGTRLTGEDGVYLPYTSGSAGVPKGTLIPHRSVPGFFRGADYAGWGPDSVAVLHSALTWDGHLLDLYPALMSGGRVLVCGPDEDDPVSVAQAAADGGATHLFLSSAAFGVVAATDPGLLAGVRYLIVGGDSVPAEHFRRALEAAPDMRVCFGYGPSETTVIATAHVVTAADLAGGPVPIGRPIGDRTVRLLDERLRPCPAGEYGELYVCGPAVGHGYLGRPALTAGVFVPDPYSAEPGARMYRTGDIARQRPDGAYEFAGRRDHQVKLRGFRVELGEIENALAAHPAVGTCAVVVREPSPGDKSLAAYLTVRDGAVGPGADALRAHLAGRLPDYMVPATFTVLPALPINGNGKVDRAALPEPGQPAADRPAAGPGGTALEQAVHRAWSQVLGRRDFGLDDNFFQLGGDSLRAVRLALLLSEDLKTPVPPKLVFASKTVSALAARLAT